MSISPGRLMIQVASPPSWLVTRGGVVGSNESQSNSTLHKTVGGSGALYRNFAINGYIEVDSRSESGGESL